MTNSRKILHPATMYFMLTLVVVVLSWMCSIYGLSVVHPQTGDAINVHNLLSPEGIRWLMRNVITNFTGFAPLGMVVVAMFGLGLAEHSGLIKACIRQCIREDSNKRRIVILVILLGLLSNVAGDAGYIILLPIASTLFYSVGIHPIAGIITAYVSVSCGYGANIILNTSDQLLAGITENAAIAAGIDYSSIGPLSNYFFMCVSTLLVGSIIYLVTVKKLLPALGTYQGSIQLEPYKSLSRKEKQALRLALTVGALYLIITLWLTFSSVSLLRNVNGGLIRSPFVLGILFLFSLGIGLMGLTYGFFSGRFRGDNDVVEAVAAPLKMLGVFFVMVFFASQMFACLEYSKLDQCLSIIGADYLSSIHLDKLWILLLFIFFTALINLIMTSGTAKWAFMAFIFVPAFAQLGISPDLTQCAFRIGDSATNSVTPFLIYVPLVITYMQYYEPASTYLTLFKHTWRYSLSILLIWIICFALWVVLGLPLGL